MLDVFITIDTEIWCNGWNNLDRQFPEAFRRYVYGPTVRGNYALPATLDILGRHGLRGIFFVESLFAARFGQAPLDELVGLIRDAGQEIQLHLHTEWVDEADDPALPRLRHKHQFLRQFDRRTQAQLIRYGKARLAAAGVEAVRAFRAGSYGLNADTLAALAEVGVAIDTSYNLSAPIGVADVAAGRTLQQAERIDGTFEYPVSVFDDGRGLRHMQVTACSLREFQHLLRQAEEKAWDSVVIVSHNFELLDTTKLRADPIVVRRFDRLCRFLAEHPDEFRVRGFNNLVPTAYTRVTDPLRSSLWHTGFRMFEQGLRRLS